MHWIAGLVVTCLLVAGARPADDHDRTRRDTEIAAVDALAKVAVRRGDTARTTAKLAPGAFTPPAAAPTTHPTRRVEIVERTHVTHPTSSPLRIAAARGPPVG